MASCVENGSHRKRSRKSASKEKKPMTCSSVFSLEHVKNSFSVVFKPREDGSRHLIVLLVLTFAIYTYANIGQTQNINLSYVKLQFPWSGDVEFNNWWALY